ncbi:MAG: hypothetical protein Q9Q40_12865 [Acidobacteriota bacterium]|nr:hypothetical protein [Acidobacteriota bacterium]
MSRIRQVGQWCFLGAAAWVLSAPAARGGGADASAAALTIDVRFDRASGRIEGALHLPMRRIGQPPDFRLAATLEPREATWRSTAGRSLPLTWRAPGPAGSGPPVRRWTLVAPSTAPDGAGEVVVTWGGTLPPGGGGVGIGAGGAWLPGTAAWYPRFEGPPRPYRLRLEGVGAARVLASGAPLPGEEPGGGLVLESKKPVDGIDLLVAERRVYRAPGQGTAVEVWTSDAVDPVAARRLAARLRDLAAELASLLGAPPWSRVVVTTGPPDAGRAIAGGLLVPDAEFDRALAEPRLDWWRRQWLRQWFGAGIHPRAGDEGVIEGLARWAESLFLPPERALADRRRLLRLAGESWRPPDAALAPAMKMHMLEILVGRQRVLGALRELLSRHRGRRVGREAFAALLRQAAGASRRPWIEAWEAMERPPRLRVGPVRQRRQGKRHSLDVTVAADPPCHLPIPVTVRGDAGQQISGLGRLAGASVTVPLRTEFPPVEVEVDPRWDLLRAVEPDDRPPVLGRALGGVELVVIGAGRGRRTEGRARLLAGTFFPAATILAEGEVQPRHWEAAARVAVLGRATERFWNRVAGQPAPQRTLLTAPRRLGVDGRSSAAAGAFVAAALAHGEPGEGLALVVDALEPMQLDRALEAVRRRPDAGWVFSPDGRILLEGEHPWPSDALRVSLTQSPADPRGEAGATR